MKDVPDVVIKPPILYLFVLVIGVSLDIAYPVKITGSFLRFLLGLPLLAFGIILMAWAVRTLRASRESEKLYVPTKKIISHGPYAFTRNPIYAAFNAGYAGIAIAANILWILILLLPAFIILHYGVVLREEKYLEKRFGNAYTKYRKRVRRWI